MLPSQPSEPVLFSERTSSPPKAKQAARRSRQRSSVDVASREYSPVAADAVIINAVPSILAR